MEGFRSEIAGSRRTAGSGEDRGMSAVDSGMESREIEDSGAQSATGSSLAAVVLHRVTGFLYSLSGLALVAASAVLTAGVIARHMGFWLQWQDEMEIFLVAGAVYISAAEVQARRGHVSIDLLGALFGEGANRAARSFTDILAFLFIGFMAFHSATLLAEAWREGHVSDSTWGPPLFIPYGLMCFGMVLLATVLAFQIAESSRLTLIAALIALAAYAAWHRTGAPLISGVDPLTLGASYCAVTLIVMLSGMPIAFALGVTATGFMILFMPASSVQTVAQNVYEELANVIILAIPLFILKGAAIGRSDAGRDLYTALHAWLYRIPGGLGIANTLACGLFAAMAGSSPATCSAIGSAGIPEMRKRGYTGGLAAGIIAAGGTLGILLPPSVTMLLYAVAAEVSLGKLFLAGIGPGLLLIVLFSLYAAWRFRHDRDRALAGHDNGATGFAEDERFTFAQKMWAALWVTPFVTILLGVMIVLYAGWATPSETAGVGAVLALLVVGVMYGVWRPRQLMPILSGTMRESSMLLLIIGFSLLYSYVMSYLHISQGAAAWLVSLSLSKWQLLGAVLLFVMILGFFLPPVSIIVMTAPVILPAIKAAGFDLIWFGVVMTIVMEMGLIHPPAGLNLFVIKNIAPDIGLGEVMWGTLPFVFLMMLAVVLLCAFPQMALLLPQLIR
jgi:C4-dicarboxylate transporter, DctM subunit